MGIEQYFAPGHKRPVVWMEVDLKEKELPTGRMGNTPEELAAACGVKPSTVKCAMYHARRRGRRCKYVRVVL